MQYVKSQIESAVADHVICYTTATHCGPLTYDGIDVNGKRVCDEILQETKRLESDHKQITRFLILGHSLGGLIARYAIGLLYDYGYFQTIDAIDFTTFCTPHVGSLVPQVSWKTKLFNILVPFLLANTGQQLFLADNYRKLPLLVWMALPESVFFKGLKCFRHRNIYANIINDNRTPYFTASLSLTDPYKSGSIRDASVYIVESISGYPNVVDITKPVTFRTPAQAQTAFISRSGPSIISRIKGLVFSLLLSPIWILFMLMYSVLEMTKTRKRVTHFLNNNNFLHLYESPDHVSRLNKELEFIRDSTEDMVNSVFDIINDNDESDLVKNLNPLQAISIRNLSTLSWNKFPVLIKHTIQTHRACIVREDVASYNEGKVVINHFINEVMET